MLLTALLVVLAQQAAAPQTPPGTTTYQLVFLRRVPGARPDPAKAEGMQQAHLDNLALLNTRGINVLWGPVIDQGPLVGIAVLNLATPEEATRYFDTDPYVTAKLMTVEARPWRGPKHLHPPATLDVKAKDALEPFILGFLVDGPNRTQDQATASALQAAHLAYLSQLNQSGSVAVTGSFLTDGSPRGLVIYRVRTADDAKALAAGDPAVKAGLLMLEAHPWMTLRGIIRR